MTWLLLLAISPENCLSPRPNSFCGTSQEPFPFVVLDYGRTVAISRVHVLVRPGAGYWFDGARVVEAEVPPRRGAGGGEG